MSEVLGIRETKDRKEEATQKVNQFIQTLLTETTPSKVPYSFEMQRMLGITGNDNENALMRKMIIEGKYEYGAPARWLILNGKLPHKEKGELKKGEVSSIYNKSKYLFALDAPFEVSSKCCSIMKKKPTHKYAKDTGRVPITAQMASESRLRTSHWLKNGCNGFDMKAPISNPMSFWTEQDVLLYIWKYKIPIASVYGDVVIDYDATGDIEGQMSFRDLGGEWELFDTDRPILKTTGCNRTGCMFCGFGCHLEKGEGRFERMKRTHPKQYDYIMRSWEQGGLNYKEVIDWINEHGDLNIRY